MRALSLLLLAALLGGQHARAQDKPPAEPVLSRFLRYVQVNTQSREDQSTVPSTAAQLDLARMLVDELKRLGATARLGDHGIVYGRVSGNLPAGRDAPAIGLICHMDTSPQAPGAGVKPIVHRNYQGGDIVLPGDTTQVIRAAETPYLKQLIGDDIVTSDGTTLLGSDDKAGCAEIMTLVDVLRQNPGIRHGGLAVGFMPDEEVGGAVPYFDIAGFGARFAYTIDGGGLGGVNDETFTGKMAWVTFKGRDGAPVRGRLVNSLYALADYVSRVPATLRPENVGGRDGYLHPYAGTLNPGESSVKFRLRDFHQAGVDSQEVLLRRLAAETEQRFPGVRVTLSLTDFGRNMKDSLDRYPQIVANAMEAIRRTGLTPTLTPIRGGTDGAGLTSRGLPTPDLFTGGSNFHSKTEFNSRRGLETTVTMLVHLVRLYAEKP